MRKSLFGYGKTTKAIALSGGWDIYDDSFSQDLDRNFNALQNRFLNPCFFDPLLSSLEIPSPGFPPSHKLIKSALNLISEYDYFANFAPKTVWISGTNGKTTTTKMAHWLFKDKGAVMGGNVGIPLCEIVGLNAKLWILETSSFTMHYTKFATPDIYALLPISPDHLSWHGSMQNYENAKLKPLEMMKEGNIAIIPKKFAHKNSLSEIIEYENEVDLAEKFSINLDKIKFKPPFLLDAVLAICLEKIIFDKTNVELLNSFRIEEHKLEEFKDSLNRTWVNDTKATNIDATIAALNRYKEKKLHLILGGDDKGVSLDELFMHFNGLNVSIYAIGSNTDKIDILARKYLIKCTKCYTLEVAVKNIGEIMLPKKDEFFKMNASVIKQNSQKSAVIDEIALLSPACSSLDQFSSYFHRGDTFKSLVNDLSTKSAF